MAVVSQNPSPQVRHTGLRSRLQTNAEEEETLDLGLKRELEALNKQSGKLRREEDSLSEANMGLVSDEMSCALGRVEDFGRTLEVLRDLTEYMRGGGSGDPSDYQLSSNSYQTLILALGF